MAETTTAAQVVRLRAVASIAAQQTAPAHSIETEQRHATTALTISEMTITTVAPQALVVTQVATQEVESPQEAHTVAVRVADSWYKKCRVLRILFEFVYEEDIFNAMYSFDAL